MSTPSAGLPAIDLERQYLLQNYTRYPLVLHKGKGCYVYDCAGKRYLDLITGIGVNALGHAHPRIVKAIRDQAGLMVHSSNLYYHEYQGPLARKIAETSGLERSFFCNSGTEAMECALKMIRAHAGAIDRDKIEIIALNNSFHGRTMGALTITGQAKHRQDFEPLLPGARFIDADDAGALEQAASNRTAGIVVETIQGEGGILPVSTAFLERARELANHHNALLVFDEIQCGVGRTGTYYAYQHTSPPVLPDIMVAAKPLACGLPLGVCAANAKAAAAIKPGMHGSTFGGNAVACRVAIEFFDILEGLLPEIVRVGGYFKLELEELGRHHAFVKEVRGRGLMIGVELTAPGKQLVLDGINEGLLFNCTHDTVLRFLPAYILTEKHVDEAIRGLKKLFKKFKPEAA